MNNSDLYGSSEAYPPEIHEELYRECLDLNLPVNPRDSIETLKHFLQAAYDEIEERKELQAVSQYQTDFNLEEEPIYIGKRNSFKLMLLRIIPFF